MTWAASIRLESTKCLCVFMCVCVLCFYGANGARKGLPFVYVCVGFFLSSSSFLLPEREEIRERQETRKDTPKWCVTSWFGFRKSNHGLIFNVCSSWKWLSLFWCRPVCATCADARCGVEGRVPVRVQMGAWHCHVAKGYHFLTFECAVFAPVGYLVWCGALQYILLNGTAVREHRLAPVFGFGERKSERFR